MLSIARHEDWGISEYRKVEYKSQCKSKHGVPGVPRGAPSFFALVAKRVGKLGGTRLEIWAESEVEI